MKKWNLILAAAVIAGSAHANTPSINAGDALANAAKVLGHLNTQANRINWAVGDFQTISIEVDQFGKLGDGRKEVTQDVPAQNALWFVQNMNVMGQAQKVETLMSREDGHVLKQIVNGKEQAPGEDKTKIEVIEESEAEIEVPAGKFDCLYIKARITQQGQQPQEVELWINPQQVNLDGMIKMAMQQQGMTINILLQDFGPRH